MKIEVIVKPLYPLEDMWRNVLNDARITVGKDELNGKVSDGFKMAILRSEHSPIRNLMFRIKMVNIPTFVSQQFSRHQIAGIHEPVHKTDVEHFVRTQRSDRTGLDRSELSQIEPVEHNMTINAQGLIDMSRKRTCKMASLEARVAWNHLIIELKQIEPLLTERMVPDCVYRGVCPEIEPCGYITTKHYQTTKARYRRQL